MKSRPILFSSEMVRALLAGTKTQTRRIVKPQSLFDGKDAIVHRFPHQEGCPYGTVGDQLWVREAFYDLADYGSIAKSSKYRIVYAAEDKKSGWRLRSPIHMPRWASRITLEITEVRCQRVQDISPQDVVAEGLPFHSDRDAYSALWKKINGQSSWDSNPWVWAISFKRLEQP